MTVVVVSFSLSAAGCANTKLEERVVTLENSNVSQRVETIEKALSERVAKIEQEIEAEDLPRRVKVIEDVDLKAIKEVNIPIVQNNLKDLQERVEKLASSLDAVKAKEDKLMQEVQDIKDVQKDYETLKNELLAVETDALQSFKYLTEEMLSTHEASCVKMKRLLDEIEKRLEVAQRLSEETASESDIKQDEASSRTDGDRER